MNTTSNSGLLASRPMLERERRASNSSYLHRSCSEPTPALFGYCTCTHSVSIPWLPQISVCSPYAMGWMHLFRKAWRVYGVYVGHQWHGGGDHWLTDENAMIISIPKLLSIPKPRAIYWQEIYQLKSKATVRNHLDIYVVYKNYLPTKRDHLGTHCRHTKECT